MNNKYKNLVNGSRLTVEDLDVTMRVQTFRGPAYFKFWKKLWKNITCRHEMSTWFAMKYCKKCSLIK